MVCAFDFKSNVLIRIHHKLYGNAYLRLCPPISVVKQVVEVRANRQIRTNEGYRLKIKIFEIFKKILIRIKFSTKIDEANF